MQAVQAHLQPVANALRNPSTLGAQTARAAGATADAAITQQHAFLARLRALDTATWSTVGIVAAETIGFFSIGEIIGRFKIVGYRSSGEHHGHH